MKQSIKHLFSAVVFAIVGIALMTWIYQGFDFRPVAKVLFVRDHAIWIVLALLTGIVANLLRAFRWRMLLRGADICIGRRRAVELVFISYLINSITPRLGELTRSLLVKRGNVEVSSRAFGTIVIEKLADVGCLTILVICAVGLRWSDTVDLTGRMMNALKAAVPSYTLFIVVSLIFCLAVGLALPRLRHLRALLSNLWKGISAISHLDKPWSFVMLCLGIWSANFLQLYLLIPCFDELTQLSFLDAVYLFAAASIGVLFPTPSGAGPWHFAIVKTLTNAFNVSSVAAKSFALVTHGLKTALVILLGVLAYITFYWEVYGKVRKQKKSLGERIFN